MALVSPFLSQVPLRFREAGAVSEQASTVCLSAEVANLMGSLQQIDASVTVKPEGTQHRTIELMRTYDVNLLQLGMNMII